MIIVSLIWFITCLVLYVYAHIYIIYILNNVDCVSLCVGWLMGLMFHTSIKGTMAASEITYFY